MRIVFVASIDENCVCNACDSCTLLPALQNRKNVSKVQFVADEAILILKELNGPVLIHHSLENT